MADDAKEYIKNIDAVHGPFFKHHTRPELLVLLAESVANFKAMAPAEQEAMLRQQRDGWVKAEMSWPRDCPYR